jgi:hypothetical protein
MSKKDEVIVALAECLGKLDNIDSRTEWSESEPDWWLKMSDIRDRIIAAINGLKNL